VDWSSFPVCLDVKLYKYNFSQNYEIYKPNIDTSQQNKSMEVCYRSIEIVSGRWFYTGAAVKWAIIKTAVIYSNTVFR
jgi:hypothetical protein